MEARFPEKVRLGEKEHSFADSPLLESVRSVSAFLAMLHVALQPLMQGGVGDLATAGALALGGSSLALWGWVLLRSRAIPAWPLLLWLPVGLLLVIGWVAASNPEFTWKWQTQSFEPREVFQRFLPSCVDASTAIRSMLWSTLQSALLLSFWDHLQHPSIARRIWTGVRWAGAFLLLLAILQKAAESDRMFFSGARISNAFFGSFFYAGSAAAYINLLMPAFAQAILRQQQTVFSFLCFGGCLACLLCNTSRIGFVVGVFQAVLLVAVILRMLPRAKNSGRLSPRPRTPGTSRGRARTTALAVAGVLGLFVLFPTPPILQKWKLLPHQWTRENTRLQAWNISATAARDASVWGMGTGCFPLVFPCYANTVRHTLQGRWLHAHCDYLEFWIERGAAGALLAGILVLGMSRRLVSGGSSKDPCTAVALGGVFLHALADFPFQNPSVQTLACLWMAQAWQNTPGSEARLGGHRQKGP
jgi:hypothetical protein